MTTPSLDLVARQFPLVPRPQPTRPPLAQRIIEITELAHTPPHRADAEARIAAAHNKAALIASDCGHSDLARTLCWRHHDRYLDRQPWNATEARRALEPLVNLARLHIRADQPDTALRLLASMQAAVHEQGSTEIDGRQVDLGRHAISTDDDRDHIRRWLWTVVLGDGIRALTRAGRWADALTHARSHRGIGASLLDGRQAAAIAHAMDGDHHTARAIVTSSLVVQPWQKTVATCLDVWLRAHAGQQPGPSSTAPGLDARDHPPGAFPDTGLLSPDAIVSAAGSELFALQSGLVILDLADDSEVRSALIQNLTKAAESTVDGTIARVVLAHPSHPVLPQPTITRLRTIRHAAAPGGLPGDQLESLLSDALGCG